LSKMKREREAIRAWDNPTPADRKRQARLVKKYKKARRKRKGLSPTAFTKKKWKGLTGTGKRLGHLIKQGKAKKVPREDWAKRKARPALKGRRACECCKNKRRLIRHHVVPVSCGGEDKAHNMVAICRKCHAVIHPWLKDK